MGQIATNDYIHNIVGNEFEASGSKCPPVSEIKVSDGSHKLDWTKFPSNNNQLVERSKIVLASTGDGFAVYNGTGLKVNVTYDGKTVVLAKGGSAIYNITGGSITFKVIGSSGLSVRGNQSGQEYNQGHTPQYTLQLSWCSVYGDIGVTLYLSK